MTERFATIDPQERLRGRNAAAAALRRGQLVGLPLDTTYGVAADAFSERGVNALRVAKGRSDLAVPVMVPRIGTVSGVARDTPVAATLMEAFWPGPLTLVLPAQPTLTWSVASDGKVAVRMPLHPVALELLARTGPLGIVGGATAGAADPERAFPAELTTHLAVVLDAGPLEPATPSAVVDLTGAAPLLVRAGPIDPADLQALCPQLVVPQPSGTIPAP